MLGDLSNFSAIEREWKHISFRVESRRLGRIIQRIFAAQSEASFSGLFGTAVARLCP